MRLHLPFVAVLLLASSSGVPSLLPSEPGYFNHVRSSVVQVAEKVDEQATPRRLGTAFLVDTKCTFATAKHVLAAVNREKLVIRFQRPKDSLAVTVPARVIYQDEKLDLAFLRAQTAQQPCHSRDLAVFALARETATSSLVGDEIVIIGYPTLAQGQNVDIPVMRRGIVASTDINFDPANPYQMLLLDLTGVPGFSGSPVVRVRTGEVAGVVYGPGPTARAAGFEWATPISLAVYTAADQAGPQK